MKQTFRQIGLLGVIVGEVAGFSGIGIAGGYFLWNRWSAPWWVMLLTSLIGLSCGIYRVYYLSQRT